MSARTGLRLIARAIQEYRGGPVLLPAYLCPAMIQPFQAEGLAVEFYPIGADLTVDVATLMGLVQMARPGAVLFVNYFGFLVSPMVQAALQEIKKRSWLIEDCVQGSLIEQSSSVVGHLGDFIVTSFRKYLPVPDGGLVINRTAAVFPALSPAAGPFVRYRLLGKLLRAEFLQGDVGRPEV